MCKSTGKFTEYVQNSHFLFHLIKMSNKKKVLQNKFQETFSWQHIWGRANKCNLNLPHTGFVCSYISITTCDPNICIRRPNVADMRWLLYSTNSAWDCPISKLYISIKVDCINRFYKQIYIIFLTQRTCIKNPHWLGNDIIFLK